MSGPYDVTQRDFLARVHGYAQRRAGADRAWKGRLYALNHSAPFLMLARIKDVEGAIDELARHKAERAAFLSEFGSLVHKAYRETFRRLP